MRPNRGGIALARACALAAAAALAACGQGPADRPQVTGRYAVATFMGVVDAKAGTVTLTPLGDAPMSGALSSWSALQTITVRQNGIWNDVGDGAVEMQTVSMQTVTGGCGTADSFQAAVEIHSGFLSQKLLRPYVEVTQVPTGNESCMSVPSPEGGVSEQFGLFPYQDIGPGGYGTGTWSFRIPTTASFTFFARVVAQPVEAVSPVTTATPPPGSYATPQPIVLACADAVSGCADTFYTLDGGATTAYVAPIRLSGTHTVCYHSVDVAGNVEADTCGTWTMNAPAATASAPGGGLTAPHCDAFASSCDTASLVVSSGNMDVPEPNQPNTLDGCQDGTGNVIYGQDESLDRLTLQTLDGGPIAPGKTVRLTAHVIAFDDTDWFNAYYATATVAPAWNLLGSVPVPPGASGPQTLTLDVTLPQGATAIRGRFGSGDLSFSTGVNGCGNLLNAYTDQDDLVFAPFSLPVGSAPPTVSITSPAMAATLSRTVLVRVAADDDVAVASVELFSRAGGLPASALPPGNGWVSRGVDTSPPWILSYDTSADVADTDLIAQATDSDGNVTDSAIVPVNVMDLTPPAVAVTVPSSGQFLSRASAITLSAVATDTSGVWTVHWLVDGVDVASSTTVEPGNILQATWNASAFPDGPHTIVARATDNALNVGESARLSFTLTP
jgi:hypothetical protein